jgi:hypothetical protein
MNDRDQKLYKGFCDPIDNKVFVYVDGKLLDNSGIVYIDGKPLILHSLCNVDFNWGSHGFGSLKLSLIIIADYTGDKGIALKYYEDFERFVISKIRLREWTMCGLFIKGWLKMLGGYDE